MAKKKAKAKSKPAKAKSAKAKSKKAKSKKSKPAKKAKAKKVKAKSKPKAKKTVAKSKSKASKKTAKKTAPKKKAAKKAVKKVAKKVAKKASKPAAKKKTIAKKPVVKKAAPVAKPVAVTTAPAVAAAPFVGHNTSLREGMMAPYFEGVDQNGNTVRSSELAGKTIILYFYPKDDTPGCTAESCSLRDEFFYLNNNNYAVIGVSADDVESHKRFADKFSLPFPLIADTDRKIINAYDVWGTKQVGGNIYDGIIRTTFVIDADGIIKNVLTKVDTANHAKQILGL